MSSYLAPLSHFVRNATPGQPTPGTMGSKPQAIVFVHGIRSNHETFEPLARRLRELGVKPDVNFFYFDYNFRQSIAQSGLGLAQALTNAFQGVDHEITIVGHSMGGLVARLSLLQCGHDMSFVRRLVMLATPNHGTLHTGTLGILAQLTREVTGKVWALTTKATGVKELTEIDRFLKPHLNDQTAPRTYHVEYVSIPATCFHEGAGWIETLTTTASRKIGLLPLAFELLKAHPCWSVGLSIPHDGIVEESSVYLGNNRKSPTRRSERRATCNQVPQCGSYVHARHDDLLVESHVTIQSADRTALLLVGLLESSSLATWIKRNEILCDFDFEPNPQPSSI